MSTPFCALAGGLRWILLFWTCVSWFWWCARTRHWKADCSGWVWVQGASPSWVLCPTSVLFPLQHVDAFRTDLLFCLSHCLTLVDVRWFSSLFVLTVSHNFVNSSIWFASSFESFLYMNLGDAVWYMNISRCFDTCYLWSMVVKSLHKAKHSGQENAIQTSMVCWSMSLFAPCAWMLPKRVAPSSQVFQCFSTFCVSLLSELRSLWLGRVGSSCLFPARQQGYSGLVRWFWEPRSWFLGSSLKRYQCKAQRQHWCWESNWREQWVFQI